MLTLYQLHRLNVGYFFSPKRDAKLNLQLSFLKKEVTLPANPHSNEVLVEMIFRLFFL